LIRASASKRNLIDRDIRTKVTISDDDVKNYFVNHYSATTSARAYHVKIITISPRSFKTSAAAVAAAKSAYKALKGGEAFEEVAKRSSDHPSAQSGGDLGILTDDQMSPAIRNELKKLKVGQVSEILGNLKSQMFILKLADIATTDEQRYEKVKDEIRNQLAASEYQHQITLWLERQRQNSFIHRAGDPSIPGL
jgi:parvulin-like peptidyl-prolyl isomerase